ncbi:MAG: cytochrome c [Rhodothermia bacterium]|nr:cytochrome c [Rhodothermia bacterium]
MRRVLRRDLSAIAPLHLVVSCFVVALVSAAFLPRAAKTQGTNSPPEAVADSAAGETVISGFQTYRAQYCGLCHAYDRAETGGIFGPPHNGMATIASDRIRDSTYTGSAKTAAEYIRESIIDPEIYIVPGFETTVHRMPAYKHLDAEEIDAMVQFLMEADCRDADCASEAPPD